MQVTREGERKKLNERIEQRRVNNKRRGREILIHRHRAVKGLDFFFPMTVALLMCWSSLVGRKESGKDDLERRESLWKWLLNGSSME